MSHRTRGLLYLAVFSALLAYILTRVLMHGDRPGCAAYAFLALFAAASITNFLRGKAAEPAPPGK
jgi:hypothetical protein